MGKKLLIVILVICKSLIVISSEKPIFKILNSNDKTSLDGLISSIYRDSKGFLWIGAPSMLVRYDGIEYTNFVNIKNDTTSLSHSDIECLFEDNSHTLWFGSKYGLNMYDDKNEVFRRFYPFAHDIKDNTNKNRIKSVCQENDSILWIASYGGGVCRFNKKTFTFKIFSKTGFRNSLPSDIVNTVYIDSKKRLWVGTESGGLSLMDTKTGNCINYLPETNKHNAMSDNTVSSILKTV